MKQYAITTDKASGITNDPNAWSEETGNLRYILDLLKCVIRLSLAPPVSSPSSPLHELDRASFFLPSLYANPPQFLHFITVMIPPFPHIMDVECTPFLCVSTSLFCAAVVYLATFWPYIQEKILKALENWKIRIFLSLIIAVAFSYFWDTLSYVTETFFLLIGGHRSTWFFFSLILCFALYCIDMGKKKGSWLSWISAFLLFFFAIEWCRLEGYSALEVSSLCAVGVFFFLTAWNEFRQRFAEKQETESTPIRLGRGHMYECVFQNMKKMMEEKTCKTVVIFGRWGEGKTHLLNHLTGRLSKERRDDNSKNDESLFRIRKINIWQYKTPEEAWEGVTDRIMISVMDDDYKIRRIFFRWLNKIFSCFGDKKISQFASFLDVLYNTNNSVGGDEKIPEISLGKLNKKLEGRKLVLVFDDVERANIDIIRFLLPLIERLKKIRNLYILCAISDNEMERSFFRSGYAHGELHDYLVKIFDFSYRLPKASKETLNQMKDKLLENRPNCQLSKNFFSCFQRILMFDTPRQLQRTVDLLTNMERCYFQKSDIFSEGIRQPEFSAFLIEILRFFYESVYMEAGDNKKLYDLVKNFPITCNTDKNFAQLGTDEKSKEKVEAWRVSYPHTNQRCKSDVFLRSILSCLQTCPKEEDIFDALDGSYARLIYMGENDCLKFIKDNNGTVNRPLDQMICNFYNSKEIAPENMFVTVRILVGLALQNLENPYYCEFIGSLFRHELTTSGHSTSVISLGSSSCDSLFLMIFEAYCNKMEAWEEKARLTHLGDALGFIYEKLDLHQKYSLMKPLLDKLNQQINEPFYHQHDEEKTNKNDSEKTDSVKRVGDLAADVCRWRDTDAFMDEMKMLCNLFIVDFLKAINKSDEECRKGRDSIAGLLELGKDGFCHEGFQEGAKAFVEGREALHSDFLKNLLEFLMAGKAGEDGRTIMYVRPSNLGVFNELVNKLSQDEKQMGSLSQEFLKEKMSVCKFSADGWRKDGERRKVAHDLGHVDVGTKQMLELLEDLLRKKEELLGNK